MVWDDAQVTTHVGTYGRLSDARQAADDALVSESQLSCCGCVVFVSCA